MTKNEALQILDDMDEARRMHEYDVAASDWSFRVAEAIIAKAAGFNSRNEWTEALSANQSTKYSQAYISVPVPTFAN